MLDKPMMPKINQQVGTMLVAICRVLAITPMRGWAFDVLGRMKARRSGTQGVDFVRASIKARSGAVLEAAEMLREELRLFPGNREAAQMLSFFEKQSDPPNGLRVRESTEEFDRIYATIKPYTMVGVDRLLALYTNAKLICADGISGDFVECGVAGGGSSALLAYVIKRYSKTQRRLFAFDTFEGLPSPGAEDTRRGISATQAGWGEGTCAAPVDCLREIAEKLGVWDCIIPVQGLFQDTLAPARSKIGPIALLHMDGDWYDSTKSILDNLYDQITPQGYVQVDDYGYWEGCKKAVDEFDIARGLNLSKQPIDACGVSFTKPN